jgi:hypothetical protein
VEVGTGNAAGGSYAPDSLPSLNAITGCYVCAAQMEIPRYQSGTVIDINHVAAQIEVVHEGDHAAIRRTHRRAHGARKVDPHVTALNDAVELPAITEGARHTPGSWTYEGALPELLRLMRPATNLERTL